MKTLIGTFAAVLVGILAYRWLTMPKKVKGIVTEGEGFTISTTTIDDLTGAEIQAGNGTGTVAVASSAIDNLGQDATEGESGDPFPDKF